MRLSRIIAVFALSAIVLTGISAVSATFSILAEGDFFCDRVEITYELTADLPNLRLQIYGAADNPLSASVDVPWDAGQHSVTLDLDDEQPGGTQLFIRYSLGGDFYNVLGDYVDQCVASEGDEGSEPGEPLPEPPYRLGGENARLKVYVVEDNGPQNPVLAFYRVNEDATGNLIFYISAAQLAADYPDVPEAPVLIFSQGPYSFYKLPSGEFQVNAGPDAEGKVDVLIFTGVPPQGVHRDQFNTNTLLGWLPPALRDAVAA